MYTESYKILLRIREPNKLRAIPTMLIKRLNVVEMLFLSKLQKHRKDFYFINENHKTLLRNMEENLSK